jgi:arylformamidase
MAGRVIDISVPLREGMVAWPGDPPFRLEALSRVAVGDGFSLSRLLLGSHTGSHLDFPAHLVPGGKGAGDYPPGNFLLPARVVHAGGDRAIPATALSSFAPRRGEALLFRTGNSDRGLLRGLLPLEEACFLSPGVAAACVREGAPLVAIDGLSVDPCDSEELPAHRILLEAGVPILEGVDLSGVAEGSYLLVCLPLPIGGADGSPVRAVLVEEGGNSGAAPLHGAI